MKKNKYYKIIIVSVFFIILIIGIAFPPNHRASDATLERSCASRLKKIYLALAEYSVDNNDYYPRGTNGLQALVNKGLLSPKEIKCPLSNIKGGLYFSHYKKMRSGSDYDYYGKGHKNSIDEPLFILCTDKEGNHNNKETPDSVNVLFSNSDTITFPIATWKQDAKKYLDRGQPLKNK